MAFINWNDLDLHTGHPVIDKGNVKIVEIVNELYQEFLDMENNSSTFVFMTGIMSAKEHIDYHFAEEEKIMKALNYPGMADHIDSHNEVRYDVNELIEKVIDDKNPNIRFLSKKLLLLMRDLLVNHITKEDKRFVKSCAIILKKQMEGKS